MEQTMIMITMNTMIMIIMTMIYYLAMAPITPPTSSFLNLNLASIRLRREIKSAKTWKKYSITFSPFLTCQLAQRRMVQELEQELELELEQS